jgi:hypothetical protein
MLTGRRERFETIRQPGGLNGFMLRTESEHDCYGAGHAGTALSAALGMAVARDMAGGKEHVVALAGDAAFTNGISFEALNNIAEQTRRLIVVLNDNEWSIDRNVGAIAQLLPQDCDQPSTTRTCTTARPAHVERFGGKTARTLARRAEEAAKGHALAFDDLRGVRAEYYGPVDGHNLPLLIETFKFLKTQDKPRAAARAHAEGARLPAGAREAEEVPRPGAVRSGDGRDQAGRAAHLLGGLRRDAGETGRRTTTRSWPSRRPCPTAPGSISSGRTIPNATSMWASPRSTR